MAHVIFWEKRGCAGNARQRAVLRASGHTLEVRDLLAEGWASATLRPFFGDQPVADWFNRAAPRIKRGEVRPETLSEAEALAVLLAEPLLIRRPLLACDGRSVCGFDTDMIAGWIGLENGLATVGEGCARPTQDPCLVT